MWPYRCERLFHKAADKIITQFHKVSIKDGMKYSISTPLDSYNLPEMALRDPSKIRFLPDEEIKHFRSFFPTLVRDLTQTDLVTDMDEVNERFREVLNYNVPTGKQLRATILFAAYKLITGKNQLSEENFREVALVAWCIEMMSSYILIMDDLIDNSGTRRGRKSWFKHEKVGLRAINDSTMIQMSVFKLIDKYLWNHRRLKDISNVFVEVVLKTFVGQVMDCEKWRYENCTMKRFNNIADNKTGYYTFYFPLVTAMFLTERPDLQLDTEGLAIFKELGRFYQMQNDFVDVYGEEYSGKVGTDIQEGKYSWLITKAIERASPVQEKLLRKCYGRWDLECVEQVKLIYEELDLRNTYDEEVKDIYQKVLTLILQMKSETARDLMFAITCTCLGYDFHLRR